MQLIARLLQDRLKTILRKSILTPWFDLSIKCHTAVARSPRRFLTILVRQCNASGSRTNLNGIKLGGVRAAHLRSPLSHEIPYRTKEPKKISLILTENTCFH